VKVLVATIAGAAALLAAGCSTNPADNGSGTGGEAAAAAQSQDAYTSVSNVNASSSADRPVANPDTPVSSDDPAPDTREGPDGWEGPGTGTAPQPKGDCPILGSSGWAAHVNAMPGPDSKRTLHVSGKLRVPTAGYKASLRLGPIAETYPLNVTVLLGVTPPSGAAAEVISNVSVSGSWPVEGDVGRVTIRCGGKTVGHVSPVTTAH
jgi:hypothetical protein